jgi:tricorn protease
VSPRDEWRQMFREAWRLQRDQFWTPDMSGVDWAAVHDRYLPLLDRVGTRAEFSDLIWEMQGELGTSHCYEMGGDYRPVPEWFQGFLGADLEYDRRTGTWKIARIPRGDSWDRANFSPLNSPSLNVREGDEILAVAGRKVGADCSPYECLVHRAQRAMTLTLRSRGKRRTISVRTLDEEYGLRYRDWVERNREYVHKKSKGRAGYVHVPDMGPFGYAMFHRYYATEVDRPGLVIDVRFNGGGHVSQLLLEKLVRRRIGYDAPRHMARFPYPDDAPMGPMVALTNEYAGSDGDIFSHAFKAYQLGPLIGKRTWGGVIGIWPRHALVDGTYTSQPEFGYWTTDAGWGLENYGTDPDIEVEIYPQDHRAGRDPQLDRGLEELEKIIRKHKPALPRLEDKPDLAPPKLPPATPARKQAPPKKKIRRRR